MSVNDTSDPCLVPSDGNGVYIKYFASSGPFSTSRGKTDIFLFFFQFLVLFFNG